MASCRHTVLTGHPYYLNNLLISFTTRALLVLGLGLSSQVNVAHQPSPCLLVLQAVNSRSM